MEDIYQHDIEAVCKHMLLRRITIALGKRVQKQGKLILYKIANHNIELTIGDPREPSTHAVVLVPYPFDYKHEPTKKRVHLHYNVNKLFPRMQFANLTPTYKPNKILNESFTITYE